MSAFEDGRPVLLVHNLQNSFRFGGAVIGRIAPHLAILSRQQRSCDLVQAKPTHLNDCFGEMCRVATTYWLHARENAASAKQQKSNGGKVPQSRRWLPIVDFRMSAVSTNRP
ncbi:hypothetical protein K3740_20930 (plasmid) [Ruegeria conchae]|uniref:hypothetical protein n=1 Tax=Ruegeria conchae TaxID=981384 RepID=UPI0021A34A0B|nr:hypothetical protein [Ruegeria conchae]UWR05716.1 hypothetical protein K3740_20930 [Ruegeria conchae]